MERLFGEAGFEKYYSQVFGKRWQGLREALLQKPNPSPFFAGKKEYFLDAASVLAATLLPLENAKNILDMCAAPGGKSLVLANRMQKDAALFCNERSQKRIVRLQKVLEQHLDLQTKGRVKTSLCDGAVLCKRTGPFYDAVLLDAPCSSERHVLSSSEHLKKWSPSRIKTLSVGQWALLSSAFRVLKAGGFLLYSTCALCESENSFVVKRLLKKFPGEAKIFSKSEVGFFLQSHIQKGGGLFEKMSFPKYEEREAGFCVLPDAQNGAGPMFFSLVKKLQVC